MSLEITYDELRREVGRMLGIGRDPDDWVTDEATDVDDILRSGLRRFYFPLVGEEFHRWSFLQPLAYLDLASGTREYLLPSDFGGMLEEFCFAAGENQRRIARISMRDMLAYYARGDSSGKPVYFAIRVKPQNPGETTRYEALFYPVPDATYTLSYRYALEPPALSHSQDRPLGGAVHSETILEACLAAAEKKLDDVEAIHEKMFQERLAASLQLDSEMGR